MEMKSVFLHGELDEKLYIKVSEEFQSKTDLIYKLKIALYGLKSVSRTWNKIINNFLKEIGFKRFEGVCFIYVRKSFIKKLDYIL